MKTEIKLEIQAQPNDETCGPTCLHALYRFYGEESIPLDRVVREVGRLRMGGTLAEMLAVHALKRGFDATIYTYHLHVFDPTWFAEDGFAHDPANLAFRLSEQLRYKKGNRRLRHATRALREFLALGGKLKLEDLTPRLITRYLNEGVPILTGLSSTYLYRHARELSPQNVPDDIRGEPQGHFVMLVGYDPDQREVLVADPLDENPPFYTNKYRLDIDRLVNAILLGALTHDANLLIIRPRAQGSGGSPPPARKRGARPRRRPASTPTGDDSKTTP